METIKSEPVIRTFRDLLPQKPYCSDDPSLYGMKIQTKDKAIAFAHIQPNHPYYIHNLVFDLDYAVIPDFMYSMVGFPLPNIITENPQNGHAHVIYQLETPIYKTNASRPKPIMYGAAIERALERMLVADTAYPGLITKNPCSDKWNVYTPREKPYTLGELAELLELNQQDVSKPIKPSEARDLGRNCCMFEDVRHWAYEEVRNHRYNGYRNWYATVLLHCTDYNTRFNIPMKPGEVRNIARSIANYCQRNDPKYYQEFIKRQTLKSKLGASKGGKARSSKYTAQREQAIVMKDSGSSYTEIATHLGVSRRTVIRWFA